MPPKKAQPLSAVPHPAWVVKKWLKQNKHSQLWLAQATGHSEKHISQIMRGHRIWSAATAERIETATGISARMLMRLKADYVLDQQRRKAAGEPIEVVADDGE